MDYGDKTEKEKIQLPEKVVDSKKGDVVEGLESPTGWTCLGTILVISMTVSLSNKTTKVAYISRRNVFLSVTKYILFCMCVDT